MFTNTTLSTPRSRSPMSTSEWSAVRAHVFEKLRTRDSLTVTNLQLCRLFKLPSSFFEELLEFNIRDGTPFRIERDHDYASRRKARTCFDITFYGNPG